MANQVLNEKPEKGLCIDAKDCGAFYFCSSDCRKKCSGPVQSTAKSKELWKKILPKFELGKCSILGEELPVTIVNKNTCYCQEHWIFFVVHRKSIQELIQESSTKDEI